MAAAALAGADPLTVSDHTLSVVVAAYRRGYRSAGHAMLAAADTYTHTELAYHFASGPLINFLRIVTIFWKEAR